MDTWKNIKERTLKVNVISLKNVCIDDVIQAVEDKYGDGSCIGCVPRQPSIIEITLNTVDNTINMCEGISVSGKNYKCEMLYSPYTVVSFMNIPIHVEDEIILL
ncbi:hypothetical protein SNE40_013579 [Patella caerulea]|uniref:Uncharacterized protein n=1 Tax=Patella caerulea TaxID=87958 RepID=A0AAN8JG83_PATCE